LIGVNEFFELDIWGNIRQWKG